MRRYLRLINFGLIVGAGLIVAWPLIIYGFPQASADGAPHAVYYTNFSRQVWAGELYPRWLMGTNGGLGSPTFFYYPPLSYYLTSLLKPFFRNDIYGWHQLGISASIGLIASGLCSYLWLEKITAPTLALIAALFYMVMPYHIHDLYGRGAFAEFWAFVWMPLILYFIVGIGKRHKWAIVGLAVSYALLITTHLITTLIFSLIPIGYAFYRTESGQKVRVVGITVIAMLLGIGLSAIYLIPAMTTQDFVSIQDMTAGYFSYDNWFPLGFRKIGGSRRYLWMIIQVGVLTFSAFLVGRARFTASIAKKEFAFWSVVVLCSIFMMTPLSKIVWQSIPFLQMILFPFRFNVLITLAATALMALSMSLIKKPYPRSAIVFLSLASLIVAIWVHDIARAIWRSTIRPDDYVQAEVMEDRKGKLRQNRAWDFRPKWVAPFGYLELEALLQKIGRTDVGITRVNIAEGTGSVIIDQWEPRNILARVDTPTGLRLKVSQFYYPGWTAYLPGEQRSFPVQPSEPEGLLDISVPRGNHQVQIYLARNPAERAGLLVSIIFAVIVLIIAMCNIFWPFALKRWRSQNTFSGN